MKKLNLFNLNTKLAFLIVLSHFGLKSHASFTTYCTPVTVNGCSSNDYISFFSLRGNAGTLISNNSGAGCSITPLAYSDFTGSFSPVIMDISNTYSGFLQTGNENDYATIWIDFNNDGIFADTERLLDNLKIGTNNLLYGIRIPAGSTLGQHRLRVRIIGSATKPTSLTDPCNSYDYSETEDYLVEIVNTGASRIVASGVSNACSEFSQMTINTASNNNGTYPVYLVDSDNNYLAGIYPDGNNLGTVRSSLFIYNGPVRQDLGGIYYLDRNLTIAVESQPISAYRFRYFFKNSELNSLIAQPGSGVTSIFDLVMTKTGNNDCANKVFDVTGIPNVLAFPVGFGTFNGDRFVDFTGLTSFSSFFLHGFSTVLDGTNINNPLPVNLLNFSVKKAQNAFNQLSWQVSNENKFAGYEIQKSENGSSFEKIGFVNASNSEFYTYLDQNISTINIFYYRLKMIDLDSKFSFSKIISIKNEIETDISIFPNPVNSTLSIENANQEYFEIISLRGTTFKVKSLKNCKNQNQLDLSSLVPGYYFLKVGNTFKKFVKE